MAGTETTYSTVDSEVKDWALFSGGHDSLASTYYCMENDICDAVLHLDTTTGIPENEMFVARICNKFGWDLRIERTFITLDEFALEYGGDEKSFGFPGPQFHSIIYRMLKEKQLETIAAETDGKPHYWTGVRKHESERRMYTVDVEDNTGSWVWHAPLHDWTDDDIETYIEENELPRNPVVENIHRSGECFCGAFENRDEALVDLQANYPEHYEWVISIEDKVLNAMGDVERAYWAHGELSKQDIEHLKMSRDSSGPVLCQDCREENINSAADW